MTIVHTTELWSVVTIAHTTECANYCCTNATIRVCKFVQNTMPKVCPGLSAAVTGNCLTLLNSGVPTGT